MDRWLSELLAHPELLRMGHCQRAADLNLGMGWLYYGLARLIRPRQVVVIGSWRGFAPIVFARALSDNLEEGQVVFIDPSLVDDFWRDAARVRQYFDRMGASNVEHHLMTTQQFVGGDVYRELGEVGIVFIDGYHTAEQARFDFEAFVDRVPANGVLLLHDSLEAGRVNLYGADRSYQRSVVEFVRELHADPRYQAIDFPFANGLTLVRKVKTAVND